MLRNLSCERIQLDEIWSFVGSKQKNAPEGSAGEQGDIWTWTAIDADTKLVPAWYVGLRDPSGGADHRSRRASRLRYRIQLSTDGLKLYLSAVENAFGSAIDYCVIEKFYAFGAHRAGYSPAEVVGSKKEVIMGNPAHEHINTSYV